MRLDRDSISLAFDPHRVDDFGNRSVDVHREPLDRPRLGDVAQVVEEPLDGLQLPVHGVPEGFARLQIDIVARNQAGAVADVLNWMREVVHQTGRDAAEHRLPLLALHVFLQLHQAIGHRVEGLAEVRELVAGSNVDAGAEASGLGGRKPARVSGAYVVLVDAQPVVYVERGGKGLQTLVGADDARLESALRALAEFVLAGRGTKLALEKLDGEPIVGSALEPLLIELGFRSGPRKLTLSA